MSHLKNHSFTGTSDHDFTGLISGEILLFDGTNITSTGLLWSASTGTDSIIANNGTGNIASGQYAVVIGEGNTASGRSAFAQGGYNGKGTSSNSATADSAFAGGAGTTASGVASHTEGSSTIASASYAHAEGDSSMASGQTSHAEGIATVAGGVASHSEGNTSWALGNYSHAQNRLTIAFGQSSHVGGEGFSSGNEVIASGASSFAHFHMNSALGNIGALASYSAILGGTDQRITAGADNSAILGGSGGFIGASAARSIVLGGLNISATTSDTVYVDNIDIQDGGKIRSNNGDAALDLSDSFGPNGTWSLTSDDGGYGSGSTWAYGQPGNGSQLSYQKDASEAIGFGAYSSAATEASISTAKEVIVWDNIGGSTKRSGNMDKRAVFIGTRDSRFNNGVVNSVVIGGTGLSATTDNTVYTQNFEIAGSLATPSSQVSSSEATATINLGVDDYYARTLTTATTYTYRLPTHTSGANDSRDGQILIIAIGDSTGKANILNSAAGSIERPGSATDADEIELTGPNSNVTLYYDGAVSKWVVTSETGTVTYIANI